MNAKYLSFVFGISILIYLMSFNTLEQQEIAFQYTTSDAVVLDIRTNYAADGSWAGYTSHVVTPVCEDRLCYDVELDMYWDLLGNFTHFKVEESKPLTKQDHIPFDETDYQKLNIILHTESPSFIHLRRVELVVVPETIGLADADATTGATAQAVKKDMVSGAIYTCYTLWHIANGGIKFKIQEYTRQRLDEKLIGRLLASDQIEAHYFLLENMEVGYFMQFQNELMDLAVKYDPYFTGRLIEKMPVNLLDKPAWQEFLLYRFQSLDVNTQNNLILKLQATNVSSNLALGLLIENLQPNNNLRNDQIIAIVVDRANTENIDVITGMFEVIENRNIKVSQNSYKKLIVLGDQFKSLKREIKQFKRAYN